MHKCYAYRDASRDAKDKAKQPKSTSDSANAVQAASNACTFNTGPSLSDVISWGETDCALPVRPDVRPDRQDKTSRDQTFENELTMTVLDDRVRSTCCDVRSFLLRSLNICGGRKAMMIRVDL